MILLLPGVSKTLGLYQQDIEDLDHYEMKEEEPVDGKKSEDDGIEKENLAILEKIRKNQRQDHLNVSCLSGKCSCHAVLIPLKNICPITLHLCRLLTSDSIVVIYKSNNISKVQKGPMNF